jgi:holliday junction DNA helicase RuvA
MIGSIKGKIIFKTEKFAIIETGGVGYKVNISPDVLSKIKTPHQSKLGTGQEAGEEIYLWIHTHVREDVLDLYGFSDYQELEFFEMLLNVSGIGPKSALAILSIASMETLRRAIGTGDTSYLTKISGIGRKTAEKIVIELRDKVGEEKSGSSLQGEIDALEALKSLGYSQSQAREALKKVPADAVGTNARIREALKILGGR